MTEPFDDPNARYVVLLNDEEQYSLWPATAGVPAGWRVVRPADAYQPSLDYVTENWTDMRPKSLVKLGDGQPS